MDVISERDEPEETRRQDSLQILSPSVRTSVLGCLFNDMTHTRLSQQQVIFTSVNFLLLASSSEAGGDCLDWCGKTPRNELDLR